MTWIRAALRRALIGQPQIVQPLTAIRFGELRAEVRRIRATLQEQPYHSSLFNRWELHDPPCLLELHSTLRPLAERVSGLNVKPSYAFLSLYGADGICPKHTDRPQCVFTVDLCIEQREVWPLFVDGRPYLLNEGDALCYWGTEQAHWRERIQPGNHCSLAFFHFVPSAFRGPLK